MPTPESADEFLRLAEESGVVDKPELEKALKSLTDQGEDVSNASTLANSLVSNKTLTRWQAGKLLEGRHQGFMLGKYRLLSLLGKGSMGTVYLAEHTMMHRRVALKVLPFDHVQQPAYLDRFMREARAVASLDHANIVRAYDVGKEHEGKRDVYYLAMEFIEGQDIAKHIKECGALDFVRAANLIRQVARGLSHAHDRGLTHRDIKPGNLLLDSNDVIKILDLGLAVFHTADQDEEASLTVSNNDHLLGTADYISPEQARNSHEVDHRTDIYSLGCTFYFMLTGFPPFRQGTVTQRLLAHQTQTPPPVTDRRPNFPADLGVILDRMLAKTTDERFQSCHDVAGELKNWLLKNATDDWKAKHPEIFTSEKIAGDSVFEDVEPPNSTSDTMIGPSPFDDEPALLAESSPAISSADLASPVVDNVEPAEPSVFVETPQNIDEASQNQPLRKIVIAICCLGALGAGLFAIHHLFSDSSTAPDPEQTPPGTVITADPEPSVPSDNKPPEPLTVDGQPRTEPATREPVKQSDPPATPPKEAVEGSPEFLAWKKLSTNLKQDPNVVLYLSFEEEKDEITEEHKIQNEAAFGSSFGIRLKPKKEPVWSAGRWKKNRALHFDGGQEGQYLTVNEFDSGAFNISGSLSVMAWFKVDRFHGRYQCIISKGDYGFRLARHSESSDLAFAINRWGGTKDKPINFDGTVMVETHSKSYPVDDDQWHLAVGVVNADSDEVTVSLFIDGELKDTRPSAAGMDPNPDPVLIGANSFFLKDKERKLASGKTVTDPARMFEGSIDEIAIFSRVLTAIEIANIYDVGLPEQVDE